MRFESSNIDLIHSYTQAHKNWIRQIVTFDLSQSEIRLLQA